MFLLSNTDFMYLSFNKANQRSVDTFNWDETSRSDLVIELSNEQRRHIVPLVVNRCNEQVLVAVVP